MWLILFLMYVKKIHQFLSSTEKHAHKRKLVPFFCLTEYVRLGRWNTVLSTDAPNSKERQSEKNLNIGAYKTCISNDHTFCNWAYSFDIYGNRSRCLL